MVEFLRRLFLTGIGALTLTKEKVEEIVEMLVKKGEITAEEGRQFVRDVLKRVEEGRKVLEEKIEMGVKKMIEKADLVTKEELKDLSKRVTLLEEKIKDLIK
jgi:polyhydroxyalkanoate synthesis regulator phasin